MTVAMSPPRRANRPPLRASSQEPWSLENVYYPDLKAKRDDKRDKGVCINGPADGGISRRGIQHGPVVGNSGKCQGCLNVHKGHPRDAPPAPRRRRPRRLPTMETCAAIALHIGLALAAI